MLHRGGGDVVTLKQYRGINTHHNKYWQKNVPRFAANSDLVLAALSSKCVSIITMKHLHFQCHTQSYVKLVLTPQAIWNFKHQYRAQQTNNSLKQKFTPNLKLVLHADWRSLSSVAVARTNVVLTPAFCHSLCVSMEHIFGNFLQNLIPQNINNPGGFVHAHNLSLIFSSTVLFYSNRARPLCYGKHSTLSLKKNKKN